MRRWLSALPALAGVLMILGVILLNGRPTVFPDVDDYFVHGKAVAYSIGYALHLKDLPDKPETAEEIADAKQDALDKHMSHLEMAARSPFYGVLLYGTQRIGTLWLLAAIQAAIGAWLIWLFWRVSVPGAAVWTAYATQAAVAFLSTLPFFAGFAMPDVFVGYVALAVVMLLLFWERLHWAERALLAALVGYSVVIHGSHLLLAVGLLVVGAGTAWLLKADRRRLAMAVLTVVAAVGVGLALSTLFFKIVEFDTGDKPGRPPFLAARLLADGPGRDYLRHACAHATPYVLCRYKNLPLTDSDKMLWSDNVKLGIFNVSDYTTRRGLETEELRFVAGTLAYDPGGVAQSALQNWGAQLVEVSIDDPALDPVYYLTNNYWMSTNLPWMIQQMGGCGKKGRGCAPTLTKGVSLWLHSALLLLALMVVGARFSRPDVRALVKRRSWDEPPLRLVVAVALLFIALVGNALICGVLSGPFARYQARITWLMTVGSAVSLASLFPARAGERDTADILTGWAARLRAQPRVQALLARPEAAWVLKTFDASVWRFGLVGATGFVIDRLVLGAGIALGLNTFTGRLVSFSVALTATWLLNRSFTFRHPAAHPPLRQALIYAAVQIAGGALNIGAYSAALALMPSLKEHLLIPLAIGSAVGLCLTYVGSKTLAFPQARSAE
jgi:putative flippase GtrA